MKRPRAQLADTPALGTFYWGAWHPPRVGRAQQQRAPLPAVGDVVTCRVSRINPRLASVEILCLGDVALSEACAGLIRREDIRAIGSEPIDVYRSLRPGDIVIARVLSLGDARAYYLSSSDVACGVVLARSSEGAVMRPVAHDLMECSMTKARELRKVAKPAEPAVGVPAGVESPPARQPKS